MDSLWYTYASHTITMQSRVYTADMTTDEHNVHRMCLHTPEFRSLAIHYYPLSCPQVNTNGVLSFNRSFNVPMPQPFPFMPSLRLISPYWEDFETQRTGRVYYRETADPALLKRAQYHLQDIFPSSRNFFPTYLFIATWNDIPQFGINGDPNVVSSHTKTKLLTVCIFKIDAKIQKLARHWSRFCYKCSSGKPKTQLRKVQMKLWKIHCFWKLKYVQSQCCREFS